MATSIIRKTNNQNKSYPGLKGKTFGIVVATFYKDISQSLMHGAINRLLTAGVKKKNIITLEVPGTVELTYGARFLAERNKPDAVICLGCVIRGETPHFDYVCLSATQGITQLNLTYPMPFIFGVLTTNNLQQAKARAGGKLGNKGSDAAQTAINMALLNRKPNH